MSIRTPLAQVRGLGSAKQGVEHFWHQRVTAVALIPLMIWFVWALASHVGADYETMRAWLSSPITSILMLFLIIACFYHMRLGVQVVIEDYIHTEPGRLVLLVLNSFVAYGLGISSAFAVLKISLGS